MKTIKFRGKRIDNGEWVFGHYCEDQRFINGTPCVDVSIIRDELHEDFEVNPETVGQYTGLDDKDKKEIYCGDIIARISCPSNHFGCSCEKVPDKDFMGVVDFIGGEFTVTNLENPINRYKRIGDIHSNPELLTNQ
jgi:uncharacterized phage protein (TIGR01671 family)